MKKFKVRIEPDALNDIREISAWYNEQLPKLGTRFQKAAIRQINLLERNPQIYAIRYREIRCVLVRKFPYLVHFYIDENNDAVEVLAVISTYQNPEKWIEKIDKK
ncbi:type II toxin-antitoxin system RelE/ParE family toxin [Mariniphaga sp.]|uniref:type II toxin-antitoxin system RelE/ParE family toxin n=1 Tax=Mariniphaga sp. TaxID=1954475 RepID=UPI0035674E0E